MLKKMAVIRWLVVALLLVFRIQEVRSGADHKYKEKEEVPIYANKVGPFHNPRYLLWILWLDRCFMRLILCIMMLVLYSISSVFMLLLQFSGSVLLFVGSQLQLCYLGFYVSVVVSIDRMWWLCNFRRHSKKAAQLCAAFNMDKVYT